MVHGGGEGYATAHLRTGIAEDDGGGHSLERGGGQTTEAQTLPLTHFRTHETRTHHHLLALKNQRTLASEAL